MSYQNTFILEHPINASIPLINLISPDPPTTYRREMRHIENEYSSMEIYQWNICGGLTSILENSKIFYGFLDVRAQEAGGVSVELLTGNPVETLNFLGKYLTTEELEKPPLVLFIHNAQLIVGSEGVQQALCNLREILKKRSSLIVLLSPEEITTQQGATTTKGLPASLKSDVLILEDTHLTDADIVETLHSFIAPYESEDIDLYELMSGKIPQATELLRSFSPFQVEQLAALSLNTSQGIDLDFLQRERNRLINNISGLSLYTGKDTFNDIQGCDNVKNFLRRIIQHPSRAPKTVVFIDEIEKALAGIAGDLSGVSQDCLGQLLSWMQDKEVSGVLFVGIPGTAKSAIAKTLGNEAGGIPSVIFDIGGLKGSLVGESERKLREALRLINQLSQERILLIATSNNIDVLPPEMKRRFNLGTWFFDLPNSQERNAIWNEYRDKYKIESLVNLNDENWTGAEIRNCCDIASRLNCSLEEASKFIVPVFKFDKAKIDALRAKADGKYISASYSGTYKYVKPLKLPSDKQEPPRKIEL